MGREENLQPRIYRSSRRAKSPEVTEGGGARRGSVTEERDQACGRAGIPASCEPVRPEGADPEHRERDGLVVGLERPEHGLGEPLRESPVLPLLVRDLLAALAVPPEHRLHLPSQLAVV